MSDEQKIRGAVVEIVAPGAGDGMPLTPTRIYVNGVDVGFTLADSLRVDAGGKNDVTTVTLTLVPSKVVIRGADASG